MEEARRENEAKIDQRRAAGYARQLQRTQGPSVDNSRHATPVEQVAVVVTHRESSTVSAAQRSRESLAATAAQRSRAPPPAPAVIKNSIREPFEASKSKSSAPAKATYTQV